LFDGHIALRLQIGVLQGWQHARIEQNAQGPCLAGSSLNEPPSLEGQHHLVNRRGCHAEEGLHVCLGRRLTVNQRVHSDERQILPLKRREASAVRVHVGCIISNERQTPQE
jgi:hypothetical protein